MAVPMFRDNLDGLLMAKGGGGGGGGTSIRSLDLLVHNYLAISKEMKKENFTIWELSSYREGVSLLLCSEIF